MIGEAVSFWYHREMDLRNFIFMISIVLASAATAIAGGDVEFVRLAGEPLIRIGLSTNAGSVTITTVDSSLVAESPDEASRLLSATRVTISARAYRPPEIEDYRIEFQNLSSKPDADDLAKDIRAATGETAIVSVDPESNTWKVWVGTVKATTEDADQLKAKLAEKGFEDAVVVTEKKVVPSSDALALTQQLRSGGKSEVRSLVKTTGGTRAIGPVTVDPNLREVLINGGSEQARYSSLKPVSFGALNSRVSPVKLNGKAYRGRLEVFVNSRGTLTVVNVVPLEDYLLGVVPSELGLPQLEAQKAQAVAARTYAVANIGGFGEQGFDMVPTVYSQVYKGVSIETAMGTLAVRQTRGIIATYHGKPIMAYFTSTCGGRTEDGRNIFDKDEPYLKGVECSLDGRRQFDPYMIKTSRRTAHIREGSNAEIVRLAAVLSINGFRINTDEISDDWLDEPPTTSELTDWINRVASRFGKTFGTLTRDASKPAELASILAKILYPAGTADTLMSDSDINYQLAFDDAAEIPRERRADVAILLRDGYFTIHPDLTLKPNKPFSRAKVLRLVRQIFEKKKLMPAMQNGVAKASTDGRLVIRSGRSERPFAVRPDVFLFRKFGEDYFPVREAAMVGGEDVSYITDASGAVAYLEIKPSSAPTSAENMSPFTNWSTTLSAGAVQSRLSRYVRGIGTLYDLNVKKRGSSRRAIELEIIGSNGVKILSGGKIRSALRLREQLFVIDKRYSGSNVASYTFTGRGWGHGVGMCQYGAFGMAKMGVKYDEIIKHYYTGVELTKAY